MMSTGPGPTWTTERLMTVGDVPLSLGVGDGNVLSTGMHSECVHSLIRLNRPVYLSCVCVCVHACVCVCVCVCDREKRE